MKTEKEFLNEMWHKVSVLERDEIEKARIKETNKRLTIKTICISIFSTVIFVLGILYNQFIKESIYAITTLTLFIAFYFEYSSMKEMGAGSYENYNIKSY